MGKYSLAPSMGHLRDGDRVVISSLLKFHDSGRVRKPEEVAVLRTPAPLGEIARNHSFESVSRERFTPFFETADGRRFETGQDKVDGRILIKDPDGDSRGLLWTLPVPEVPDEDAIAFARAFNGLDTPLHRRRDAEHEPNVLLLVDRVARKYVSCRIVSWVEDTLGEHAAYLADDHEKPGGGGDPAFRHVDVGSFPNKVVRRGALALSNYQTSVLRADLPVDLRAGSLVVASSFHCEYRKSSLVTVIDNPAVAGHVSKARLEHWLVRRPDVREERSRKTSVSSIERGTRIPLATVQKHLMEIERAKAWRVPSEALVLVYPPDAGEEKKWYGAHLAVVGLKGGCFFDDCGEAHDGMEDSAPREGGLWVFEEARYWADQCRSSGEWDGGLEGRWRPATADDVVRFAIPKADLDALADEYEGGDHAAAAADGSFIEEMMRLSQRVHDEERRDRPRQMSA